jgi:hypothetical protein
MARPLFFNGLPEPKVTVCCLCALVRVPLRQRHFVAAKPQTLNLYSMVSDDPESSADLDGHDDDVIDKLASGPRG